MFSKSLLSGIFWSLRKQNPELGSNLALNKLSANLLISILSLSTNTCSSFIFKSSLFSMISCPLSFNTLPFCNILVILDKFIPELVNIVLISLSLNFLNLVNTYKGFISSLKDSSGAYLLIQITSSLFWIIQRLSEDSLDLLDLFNFLFKYSATLNVALDFW